MSSEKLANDEKNSKNLSENNAERLNRAWGTRRTSPYAITDRVPGGRIRGALGAWSISSPPWAAVSLWSVRPPHFAAGLTRKHLGGISEAVSARKELKYELGDERGYRRKT